MNNLNEVPSVKIGTILGYECYVPKSYYSPISFLNKGCPVWIKTGEDGNCNVMTIGNGNAYEEIGDYIKTTLGIVVQCFQFEPVWSHPLFATASNSSFYIIFALGPGFIARISRCVSTAIQEFSSEDSA